MPSDRADKAGWGVSADHARQRGGQDLRAVRGEAEAGADDHQPQAVQRTLMTVGVRGDQDLQSIAGDSVNVKHTFETKELE
eukprot:428053-Rhodomonas_salina.1